MNTADIREDNKNPDMARTAFVETVINLCRHQPGARQALRQALRKAYDEIPMATHKYVVQAGLPADPLDSRQERARAYYTVAALIARIPARVPVVQPAKPREAGGYRTNLGASLAEGVRVGTLNFRSAEAALAVLGKQSTNGIHLRLPGIVARITDRPEAVDWVQLLTDLEAWSARRAVVARRWQQSFYHNTNRADREAAAQAADAESSTSTASPAANA